jgi:GAF domain-containing protein
MNAHLPENETGRLATLRAYQILDTQPDTEFDLITVLASKICDVPIALVSLVDERRQWFKSKIGLNVSETNRNIAFCGYAILQRDVMEVRDARADQRFAGNPLVTSDPHIRFYAGAPLVTADEHALGTVCVLDDKPRTLTGQQRESLSILSQLTMAILNFRKEIREVSKLASEREWLIDELNQTLAASKQREMPDIGK